MILRFDVYLTISCAVSVEIVIKPKEEVSVRSEGVKELERARRATVAGGSVIVT